MPQLFLSISRISFNRVNQRLMYFPKCVTSLLFGSTVTLILYLDANFAFFLHSNADRVFPKSLAVE